MEKWPKWWENGQNGGKMAEMVEKWPKWPKLWKNCQNRGKMGEMVRKWPKWPKIVGKYLSSKH